MSTYSTTAVQINLPFGFWPERSTLFYSRHSGMLPSTFFPETICARFNSVKPPPAGAATLISLQITEFGQAFKLTSHVDACMCVCVCAQSTQAIPFDYYTGSRYKGSLARASFRTFTLTHCLCQFSSFFLQNLFGRPSTSFKRGGEKSFLIWSHFLPIFQTSLLPSLCSLHPPLTVYPSRSSCLE